MASTDDIMRQLNRKRKRNNTPDESESIKTRDSVDNQQNQEPEEVVEPDRPKQSKQVDEPTPIGADDDHEHVNNGVVEKVTVNNGPTVPKKRKVKSQPVSEPITQPEPERIESEPEINSSEPVTPDEPKVPEHPEIERNKPRESFKDLGVFEKLMFKDVFINQGGEIVYNTEHSKTVAKNLSKGIMDQIIEDLKHRHLGVQVGIGSNQFTIRETNSVFTSPTSLVRYLMLDKIEDENTALQVARQLFLEKHPEGEKADFDHKLVRTDERDIYALVLSTKADPEKDLVEKVEELIRTMDYLEENTTLANRRLLEQTTTSNDVLNGMNIALSLMVLERLGLTEGTLPRSLDDIRGFTSQDNIVKMSDLISNDIASDVKDRKRTIARDERMKQSNERMSRRGRTPRSINRGLSR